MKLKFIQPNMNSHSFKHVFMTLLSIIIFQLSLFYTFPRLLNKMLCASERITLAICVRVMSSLGYYQITKTSHFIILLRLLTVFATYLFPNTFRTDVNSLGSLIRVNEIRFFKWFDFKYLRVGFQGSLTPIQNKDLWNWLKDT